MDGGHCGSSLFFSEINCTGDEARQTPLSQEKEEIHYFPTCLAYWASLFPHLHQYEEEWRWLALALSIHQPPLHPPTFSDGPIKKEQYLLLKKIGAKPLENKSQKKSQGRSWMAREWCVYTLTLVSSLPNWQTGFWHWCLLSAFNSNQEWKFSW